ncbi:MAG: hypothetical protein LBQ12_08350 [Deltaproteobacteria bacterium]|jgi:hypothetical protein|nr:hypothetical protein [Deltaproteobacteria bacterium]
MGGKPADGAARTAFGFKIGAVKLWAIALLAATVLSGAEVTYGGRRDFLAPDQFRHAFLSGSMAQGFLEMTFPPRVSPILADGLGNPYHQFSPPLAHAAVGALGLLLRDLVAGYTYGSVFLMALAFVYAYRLGRYLTLSDRCAAFAAFLFVTAPYLAADRVLRGAFDEYFAFALLPVATYYNLRALPLASYRIWALAVLSTAALLLSHFITGAFFLFFYLALVTLAVFFALARRLVRRGRAEPGGKSGKGGKGYAEPSAEAGISGKGLGEQPPPRVWPFARKALAAISVAAGAILVCMWWLGPFVFYGDLAIKGDALANASAASSAFMTPVLSLFSLTDSSWSFSANQTELPRFQTGILLLASLTAFLYYSAGRRTSWALPFSVTALAVLFVVARPAAFLYPPLKYMDIAQYSYRLLSLFALAGSAAGALALKAFFRNTPGFSPASRSVAAMALAAFALAMAAPYVYPKTLKDSKPFSMNSDEIRHRTRLLSGEGAFMRVPPAPEAGGWTDPGRPAVPWSGKAGDWRFTVDLEEWRGSSGGPSGEALLDVLYYPGLQDIELSVDGKPADLVSETYWQKRKSFERPGDAVPGAFHGLKISGLPEKGTFRARVRFTGFVWANRTSAAAILLLLGGQLRSSVRARRRSRVLARPLPTDG